MSRGIEWGSAAKDAMARVDAKPALVEPEPTPITAAPTARKRPARKPAQPTPTTSAPATGPEVPAGGVGYDKLKAKTLRFHESQSDAIQALVRVVNEQRAVPKERITDNTLIRLAVELLLERKDELAGSNEAELAASLGLRYLND
jgi:hypothetical protein